MRATRVLGNRLLIRYFDFPKAIGGIEIPSRFRPKSPLAMVIQKGEGRVGTTGHKHDRYKTNHALELLAQMREGDVVRVNVEHPGVAIEHDGQLCHIVSSLDIQAIIEQAGANAPKTGE
jgi:co-chaperonin GroES (HSP10)